MKVLPTFNSTRDTTPVHNLGTEQLAWALAHDPILRQRTEAVRSATDPAQLKLKLPAVCLGGPFKALPPTANHGPRCRGRCSPSGYRNAQHIDWQARTGLVLIDIDDTPDPNAVKFLLKHSAPEVAISWVSARGMGLKVGVLTSPIADTTNGNRDAWAAAYAYIVEVMKSAGMTEGKDYKIDSTPAASQMAILAHDPAPLVRTAEKVVKWSPPSAGAPRPPFQRAYDPLVPAQTVGELATQLGWTPGSRSNSMHRLGIAAAMNGISFESARVVAQSIAATSGLVSDYGLYPALRHFDRGFWWARESLLDGFGWQGNSDSVEVDDGPTT